MYSYCLLSISLLNAHIRSFFSFKPLVFNWIRIVYLQILYHNILYAIYECERTNGAIK